MHALLITALAAAAGPAAPDKVSYSKHVMPIFRQHCLGCHQPAKALGGYLMTDHASLLKAGDRGKPGVVPGDAAKSYLVDQIKPHGDAPPEMPKAGLTKLTEIEIATVTRWVEQGAKDDTPAAAKAVVDMDHPPVYRRPPVVTDLAYSPGGELLAVTGYHEVVVWAADGSEVVSRLVGLSERVQSVAFSPDGKLLAAAGGSPGRFGEVQIWDVDRERLKRSITVTYDTLYGVSWSHDGQLVAFGCGDNRVRAYHVATGKEVLQQGTHADWVLDTVFSRESEFLVSVSRDMSMKLTHVPTQRFMDNVTSITPGALKGGLTTVSRRPIETKRMAKVPGDTPKAKPKVYDELLTAGSDGVPRLYKMHREKKRKIGDDYNRIHEYAGMPGRIYTTDFADGGSLFAAGSSLDGTGVVRVYETDSKKVVSTVKLPSGVFAVDYRPGGRVVAAGGFDGKVRLIDAASGEVVREFVAVPLTAGE